VKAILHAVQIARLACSYAGGEYRVDAGISDSQSGFL